MAGQTLLNIGIVLMLILIEGLFVAAEIALVSLREGQVRALAESGRRGAIVARLVSEPNRFLAAVQIGVTTTALLSSAFGAVTLSDEAKNFLIDHGWSDGLAAATGVIGVTLIITFVTLVGGALHFCTPVGIPDGSYSITATTTDGRYLTATTTLATSARSARSWCRVRTWCSSRRP